MLVTCLFSACAASRWHARRVYKTLQIPTKTKSHSQAGWHNAALWKLAMSLGIEVLIQAAKDRGILSHFSIQPLFQAMPTRSGCLGSRPTTSEQLRGWAFGTGALCTCHRVWPPSWQKHISQYPMFLQPLVPTAHVSEESASKASIRELRPAVRSPFSLLKAEESH